MIKVSVSASGILDEVERCVLACTDPAGVRVSTFAVDVVPRLSGPRVRRDGSALPSKAVGVVLLERDPVGAWVNQRTSTRVPGGLASVLDDLVDRLSRAALGAQTAGAVGVSS